MLKPLLACLACLTATNALAAPVTYNLDPNHTYPSFEADHFGTSILRGKFDATSGKVVYDKDAKAGTVEVTVDTTSLDFGHPKLNEHVKSAEMFDVAKYPTAVFQGKLAKFVGEQPTAVEGTLTLHGVTKPVTLTINQFKCMFNKMFGKEVCGADAEGTINRADFGIGYGEQYGFKMDVKLRIEVEGQRAG
jgi:polyisoprenoid-binding protein YceI